MNDERLVAASTDDLAPPDWQLFGTQSQVLSLGLYQYTEDERVKIIEISNIKGLGEHTPPPRSVLPPGE